MKFAIRDHQGKSRPYAQALTDAGHEQADLHDAEVILVDYDLLHPAYVAWFEAAKGRPLLAYPHGFSATWVWDLMGDSSPVAASFVPGSGQKHLLERYEYPHPVHVVGWPGEPTVQTGGVVFAPHHPLGSGYLPPEHREENARAFRLLLKEADELTVRYVGTLEQNGIWREEGVTYISGEMGGEVLTGDVTVAGGTYAAHCLAADKAVVMYHQEREWRLASEYSSNYVSPWGWDKRTDYTRYPYDLAPGVCADAKPDSREVSEWKERFMPTFDAQAFTDHVEQYAGVPA